VKLREDKLVVCIIKGPQGRDVTGRTWIRLGPALETLGDNAEGQQKGGWRPTRLRLNVLN